MSAIISECGKYRYALKRGVEKPERVMMWVMLNPSTADSTVDDPTIRKCMEFAKRNGHDAIVVVNLYAFRSTDPNVLTRTEYYIGPDNDKHIDAISQMSNVNTCVIAWGAHRVAAWRAKHVIEMLDKHFINPMCLGQTKDGSPKHPLYVPYAQPLVPYES